MTMATQMIAMLKNRKDRLEVVPTQERDIQRKQQVVLSCSKTRPKTHEASSLARNNDLTAMPSLWGNSLWHRKNQLAQPILEANRIA